MIIGEIYTRKYWPPYNYHAVLPKVVDEHYHAHIDSEDGEHKFDSIHAFLTQVGLSLLNGEPLMEQTNTIDTS